MLLVYEIDVACQLKSVMKTESNWTTKARYCVYKILSFPISKAGHSKHLSNR